MTPKFTIPPLAPDLLSSTPFLTHRDSYLAGIDAVIAALRQPDEAMQEATWGMGSRTLAALADEIERRKP